MKGGGEGRRETLARKLHDPFLFSPPPPFSLLFFALVPPFRRTRAETLATQAKQNSGPVNFVPESRLPLVQISYIYQKTAAKA